MPELSKLIDKKFSKVDNEWQWTYSCLFKLIFNTKTINEVTITDHTWKKKGREKITKKLILELLAYRINGERLIPEPKKNPNWKRDHFVVKRLPYQNEKYKLVFWFKDNTDNHLWIKVCHLQD